MATAGRKLLPRQRQFVAEYLVDLNATQAAIRAGYSAKSAKVIGCENLTKPDVADAIVAAQQTRAARTGVTQERVLIELGVLSFSDIRHYQLTHSDVGLGIELAPGAPDEAMRAIASVKHKTHFNAVTQEETRVVEFKFWDKNSGLQKAAQHLGMLKAPSDEAPLGGRPVVNIAFVTVADLAAFMGKR